MSAEHASSTCRQLAYYTFWPLFLLFIWFLSEWRCWWSTPHFSFSNGRCSLIESKICAWSEIRIAQLPVWLLQAAEPCKTWKSHLLPTCQSILEKTKDRYLSKLLWLNFYSYTPRTWKYIRTKMIKALTLNVYCLILWTIQQRSKSDFHILHYHWESLNPIVICCLINVIWFQTCILKIEDDIHFLPSLKNHFKRSWQQLSSWSLLKSSLPLWKSKFSLQILFNIVHLEGPSTIQKSPTIIMAPIIVENTT